MKLRFLVLLLFIYFVLGCGGGSNSSTDQYVPTKPFAFNEKTMTQEIPAWGSAVRLVLPVQLNEIVLGESGGIGAYGAHQGAHTEGLNHIWLPIISGTVIHSWADGKVINIEDMGARGNGTNEHEYFISIDYGDGLIGKHLDVTTPLVSLGDSVLTTTPIAMGPSAEFQLLDNNRTDGERTGGYTGALVSPFDYLKDDVKAALLTKFNSEVVEPFFKKGLSAGNSRPWEPRLTHKMLFHEDFKGTIVGEWILASKDFEAVDPLYFDVLTVFDVTNEFGHFQKAEMGDHDWSLPGNKNHTESDWNSNDGPNTIVFETKFNGTFYGLYTVIETDGRAKLTIEWQKDSYPLLITNNAAVYRERSPIYLKGDAELLGITKKR
jgi:hypothetical protein